ncbi:MAG: hypothetical protein ACOX6T_00115 [Myxococcales bacterium]|jgi:hypothetical protein
MKDPNPWPELPWEPGTPRLEWLLDRVAVLADRTCCFELGIERAIEAGEVSRAAIASELDAWEHCAANVYLYVGLREAQRLSPEDVPAHAEELEKVWRELIDLRSRLLERLGDRLAGGVFDYETVARVDDAEILRRVGELPAFVAETNVLTGEQTLMPSLTGFRGKPVTADEVRMRQSAEQKLLPEPATLEALLAHLPSDWASAIFDILGLDLPDAALGAPRAARRKAIADYLGDEEQLEVLVAGLPDEARELLAKILERGGAMRYLDAVEKPGLDEADGFYWTARPPSGPLAWLRRMGLAFVGVRGGQKVVVVASDLRKRLKAALAQ